MSELKPHGYLNQCIWEVVVGSGGVEEATGCHRSEKLAEVGRGHGWGESARRWHGKMKSISPSRSKVKDQPVLETPRSSLA